MTEVVRRLYGASSSNRLGGAVARAEAAERRAKAAERRLARVELERGIDQTLRRLDETARSAAEPHLSRARELGVVDDASAAEWEERFAEDYGAARRELEDECERHEIASRFGMRPEEVA